MPADPDKAKAQAVGQSVIDAWAAGDRAAAANGATPDVVSALFARPYTDGPYTFEQCSGGVGNFLCNYDSASGATTVQLLIWHVSNEPMIAHKINIVG